MRVVIVDRQLRSGRKLAAQIESVHPEADVLLYAEPQKAVAGIVEHSPDVVLVTNDLGAIDGPRLVEEAKALPGGRKAKFVGIVDEPSAEWSARYVDAGATLVVARPLEPFSVRMALRHAAGGVPA